MTTTRLSSLIGSLSAAVIVTLLLALASPASAEPLRIFRGYAAGLPPGHAAAPAIAAMAAGDRAKATTLLKGLVAKQPALPLAYDLTGFLLAESGDLDGAATAFRKSLSLASRPRITHAALGEVLFLKGDYPEARKNLTTYLSIAPTHRLTRAMLGRVDEVSNDLPAAVRQYEMLLPATDDVGRGALLSLVSIHIRLAQIDKARARLRECLGPCQSGPAFTLATASLDRAEGRRADAERTLAALVKTNPQLGEAWWELGGSQRESGSLASASASFTRLAALPGWKPIADMNLASVKMLQNDAAGATALLTPLVARKVLPDAYALLSEIQAAQGDKIKPEKTLRALTADFPTFEQGHLLLGLFLLSTERTSEARQSLQTAVKLRPELVQGWIHLSNLAAVGHRTQDAERLLREGLAASPNNPDLLFHLGLTLELTNNWPGAAEAYRASLALRPNDTYAMANRARMLVRTRGNLDEAERLMRAAHAANRQNALMTGNLGWVLVNRGNMKEGVPLLQQAVAGQRDNAELHYYLSVAYRKQGRAREADEALRLAREYGLPPTYEKS
jgi:predicted Zn-dependent protease